MSAQPAISGKTAPAFSPQGYADLLATAKEAGYTCAAFRNAFAAPSPALILRHDVDFSLAAAVRLAELEAELGVQSTYFVMVANDYYNSLAKKNRERLRRLIALGHEVGLHWDSSTYPDNERAMADQFTREIGMLGDIIGEPVISASQHIPTDSPLFDVESLIQNEAYAAKFRARFQYVSDSSMAWRAKTPLDLLAEGVEMQFNSHPLWWVASGDTREEKLRSAVNEQLQETGQGAEAFITYMNKILADRARVDAEFRQKKGW
jgi:hypothetical protein